MRLEDLSLTQLRKLVRAYNMHVSIKGYSKMSKEALINEMKKHFEIINNFLKVLHHNDIDVSNVLVKKKREMKPKKVKLVKTIGNETKRISKNQIVLPDIQELYRKCGGDKGELANALGMKKIDENDQVKILRYFFDYYEKDTNSIYKKTRKLYDNEGNYYIIFLQYGRNYMIRFSQKNTEKESTYPTIGFNLSLPYPTSDFTDILINLIMKKLNNIQEFTDEKVLESLNKITKKEYDNPITEYLYHLCKKLYSGNKKEVITEPIKKEAISENKYFVFIKNIFHSKTKDLYEHTREKFTEIRSLPIRKKINFKLIEMNIYNNDKTEYFNLTFFPTGLIRIKYYPEGTASMRGLPSNYPKEIKDFQSTPYAVGDGMGIVKKPQKAKNM